MCLGQATNHRRRIPFARMIHTTRERNKDVQLECLRGLASISVLAHHIILAFFPAYSGVFVKTNLLLTERSSFFSFATNGTAAVVFFFLLSGFVLSRGFFTHGDRLRVVEGALKRWPRLCGPVVIAVLFSWVLLQLGLYKHEEVGTILNSPWLAQFAFAYDRGSAFPSTTLWSAVSQGTFFVFVRGDDYYNTNLWTMRYEFTASYVVFGLCLLVGPKGTSRVVRIVLLLIACLIAFFFSSLYLAFVVGTALAALLPIKPVSLPFPATIVVLGLSLFFLGYYDNSEGPFQVLRDYLPTALDQYHVTITGSVLLIIAVECSGTLRRGLSTRLAMLLGELSFPLYLVHIPIISAVGCNIFLLGRARHWTPTEMLAGAAGSTILASLLCAVPLMIGNRYWIRIVSYGAQRLVGLRPRVERGAS